MKSEKNNTLILTLILNDFSNLELARIKVIDLIFFLRTSVILTVHNIIEMTLLLADVWIFFFSSSKLHFNEN